MLGALFRISNRPYYGLDAPDIVKRYALFGLSALILTLSLHYSLPLGWIRTGTVTLSSFLTLFLLFPAFSIVLGSFYFKFKARDLLLKQLIVNGHETILDVGCGSGLLLIGAAKRLTHGKAIGVDLWKCEDQSSNNAKAPLRNAEIEGVREKVHVITADMREIPFSEGHFDIVLSSWGIHNIYQAEGRIMALEEMIRVLKPGGQIAILDIINTQEYADHFKKLAMIDIRILGPYFTFGTPSHLILAKKPQVA